MKNKRNFQNMEIGRALCTFTKKIPLVMKLFIFYLFCSIGMLQAVETYAQNARLSLNVEEETVANILRQIEDASDFDFFYNNSHVDLNRRVSVSAQNSDIFSILDEIFEGTEVRYTVLDKKIILSTELGSSTQGVQQQGNIVKGKVVDVNGEPVIGATIKEVGTSNGTVTDVDGNFTINTQADATLEVSFIGYQSQTLKAVTGKELAITLKEDTEMLDEVVVIGYGIQKKVNLTGAVSTVKGEELSQRPVANATQSLQGLIPGLTVNNVNAGRPGSSNTLTLRGQGNLNNTANPYVLVDGIEMDLSDVNPNDIESISVLKDAAAASIYGARAAYGVILVTTKKGEAGKTRISYQGTVGWSSPTVLPTMANSYDFATYFNQGCTNAGVPQQYSPEKIELLQQYIKDPTSVDCWADLNGQNNLVAAFENTANGVGNVDYFKLHYKNSAFKQNHNISFSGGNPKAQYYISGGMYTEDGILRYADMDYRRFNFNANINSQITKWLKIKINTKFTNSDTDSPFGEGGLSEGFFHSLARFRPTVSPIDPNGHFTELTMIPYLQSGTYTDTAKNNLTLNGGFEINPIKNWQIFFDYSYKQNCTNYQALNVAPMIPGADNTTLYKGTRVELGVEENGKFTRSEFFEQYQSINLYTNYKISFKEKHNFTLMGGYQEDNFSYKNLYSSVTDLISASNPGLELGTGNKTIKDIRNGWATRGFFGRINYDYKGRYLMEINGRYDGSSRFSSDHRWGFFPSVSLGWNIAHENFMKKSADYLSLLKLRISWGLLGNQNGADLYTFAGVMSIEPLGKWYFQNGREMYIKAPGVVDPYTTWEKVESKNIGVDFGFFNNALTGSFDIFQRDTKDMLGPSADFPDFFGAQAPKTNNAQLRNRGWEFAIQYQGKIGEDINYSIGSSIADAKTLITAYENPSGTDPQKNWYTGKNAGEIWGYRASGLIQSQEEADEYNKKYDLSYLSGHKWVPGDVKYLDLNGDNKIDNGTNTLKDMGDMTVIGNTTPRYQYTINGSISWKDLSLSLMFQGVGKRDWAPDMYSAYFWGAQGFAGVHVFKEHLDYWRPDNPNAYYPNPYIAGGATWAPYASKVYQVSDRYIQNAAYCRLKNLTLSYNLPLKLINKIGLTKAQIFFSGENLLTFTQMPTMFDPEGIFVASQTYSASKDGKNYPMNKVYSIGVIINL